MKRRGFLGLLGGAAVAGPGMAREAIGMAATQIGGVNGGVGGLVANYGAQATTGMNYTGGLAEPSRNWAAEQLSKLIGKTAAEIAKEKAGIYVHSLDPDLAEMRSIRLHAKMRIQREREWQRMYDREKGHLERMVAEFLSLDKA